MAEGPGGQMLNAPPLVQVESVQRIKSSVYESKASEGQGRSGFYWHKSYGTREVLRMPPLPLQVPHCRPYSSGQDSCDPINLGLSKVRVAEKYCCWDPTRMESFQIRSPRLQKAGGQSCLGKAEGLLCAKQKATMWKKSRLYHVLNSGEGQKSQLDLIASSTSRATQGNG